MLRKGQWQETGGKKKPKGPEKATWENILSQFLILKEKDYISI